MTQVFDEPSYIVTETEDIVYIVSVNSQGPAGPPGTGSGIAAITASALYPVILPGLNTTVTLAGTGLVIDANSSGSVNTGTIGQVAYYGSNGNIVGPNSNIAILNGNLSIGNTGVVGSLTIKNAATGSVTLGVQPNTGTTIINLPTGQGSNGYSVVTDGNNNWRYQLITGTGSGSSTPLPSNLAYIDSNNNFTVSQLPASGSTLTLGSTGQAWKGLYIGVSKFSDFTGTTPTGGLGYTGLTNTIAPPALNSLIVGGILSINYLSAPPTPTVTTIGASGTLAYGYVIVPIHGNGLRGVASSAGLTVASSGVATLTTSDFQRITWGTASYTANNAGCTFDVYRTVVPGGSNVGAPQRITTGLTKTTFDDIGIVSSTTSLLPENFSGLQFRTISSKLNAIGTGISSPADGVIEINSTRLGGLGQLSCMGVSIGSIPDPVAPDLFGSGSGVLWGYKVVWADASGNVTTAASPEGTGLSYTTLNNTNVNVVGINGTAPANYSRMWVYRTTAGGTPSTTGLIYAGVYTSLVFDRGSPILDIGISNSVSPPTFNTTGSFIPSVANTGFAGSSAKPFKGAYIGTVTRDNGVTTVPGGSGNLYWSMPERGNAWRKVVIVLDNYSAAGTTTITFPIAFNHTPSLTANGTSLTGFSLTTADITIPTSVSQSGTVIVEGM